MLTAKRTEIIDIPGLVVKGIFDPVHLNEIYRVADYVKLEQPDWVILQYNPFSFHARGLNLHLPLMMGCLKIKSPKTKIAVMVHEASRTIESWRHVLSTCWLHWSLWKLGSVADVLCFSIDPWVYKYQAWFPNTKVLHLPVGSNIPLTVISKKEAKRRLGIESECFTLGIFGRVQPSLSLERIRDAICVAKKSGRPYTVLYIGSQGLYVSSLLTDSHVISDGQLSHEEVSYRFHAMDSLLVPFVEGVSSRRSSLMAGLQHGIAIAGTQGQLTDRILIEKNEQAMLLAPLENRDKFKHNLHRIINNPTMRDKLGRAGQLFYQENFSWNVLVKRMTDAMKEKT